MELREELEGRLGGPGKGKRASATPSSLSLPGPWSLVLLTFLLALPWALWKSLKLAYEKLP